MKSSGSSGYDPFIHQMVETLQYLTMNASSQGHEPVLLHEVIEGLHASQKGRYLDCTFGGGGHTRAILEANPENEVVALDRDPEALERSRLLKEIFDSRFECIHASFSQLLEVSPGPWDGILMDLGVSSFQLDQPERGFSFREEGPLDMRMDPGSGIAAKEWLNQVEASELVRVLREYGEEPFAKPIARAILEKRHTGELETTRDLARIVEQAVPARQRYQRSIHPATLTFQAIRIAVNSELDELEAALEDAFKTLVEGGRMAVISFHSLEDRMVKRFFRRMSGKPETRWDSTPMDLRKVFAKQLTNRPIEATEAEKSRNPRSRSARLRILQKIDSSIL